MKYAAPNLSLYTVLGKAYSACHYAFKYNSTSSNIPAGHESLFFCLSPLPFPVTEPTLSQGRKGERKDRGQKRYLQIVREKHTKENNRSVEE